jgi:hypothetical protein
MWTGWTGGGLIQAGVQQPLFGSPLNKCIPGDLSPLIILLRDVTRKLSQRTEHGAWPALCALPVVEEETPNSPSTPQSDSLFSVLEVILHSLQGRGDEVSKKQKAFFYISQALAPFLNQFPDDPKNLTNKVLQAIEVKLDLSPEVLYKITAQAGHAQYFQRLLERLPHPNHEAVYDLYKIAAENGHVPLLSLLEDKFANTPETEEALILNAACPALWLANACSQSKVVAHLMQYPQVREHAEGQPAERRNTSVALELMRFQLMARRQSRLRVDSRNSIDLQEEPAAKLPKRSPAASRLAQGECTEESVEPPHSPVQLRRG